MPGLELAAPVTSRYGSSCNYVRVRLPHLDDIDKKGWIRADLYIDSTDYGVGKKSHGHQAVNVGPVERLADDGTVEQLAWDDVVDKTFAQWQTLFQGYKIKVTGDVECDLTTASPVV